MEYFYSIKQCVSEILLWSEKYFYLIFKHKFEQKLKPEEEPDSEHERDLPFLSGERRKCDKIRMRNSSDRSRIPERLFRRSCTCQLCAENHCR